MDLNHFQNLTGEGRLGRKAEKDVPEGHTGSRCHSPFKLLKLCIILKEVGSRLKEGLALTLWRMKVFRTQWALVRASLDLSCYGKWLWRKQGRKKGLQMGKPKSAELCQVQGAPITLLKELPKTHRRTLILFLRGVPSTDLRTYYYPTS